MALKRTHRVSLKTSREQEMLTLLKESENVVNLVDNYYTTDQQQRIIQNSLLELCESSFEYLINKSIQSRTSIGMEAVKLYTKQLF